jgi:eukaryotic-like serine/threonine-protein kinase
MRWFGARKKTGEAKATEEPQPSPREEPRRTIGKYEIVEKIATGGFGTVYEAWDPMIRRAVALKTCEVPDANVRARVFREARLAGSLQHPNITTIYEFGEEGIVPFLVQELLSGEDLAAVIARRDPMPVSEKVRILIAVASGLEYAHGAGIVHRDIKPSNIRILDNGAVKIMDFGIAKSLDATTSITKDGTAVGSTGYMSPEQIVGEAVDSRTDLFSFGVVAYELLSLQKPFHHDKLFLLLEKIVKEEPEPLAEAAPDIPASLVAIVEHAMRKEPAERFSSAGELKAALEAARDALRDVPSRAADRPEARETARLRALDRYAILDTAPEPEFDDLTRLASVVCGVPLALLAFVDRDRLWFKSNVGFPEPEVPREASVGARMISESDVIVVRDAAQDHRFAGDPLLRRSPGVRFYAGAPLTTGDGHAVGVLCVMDLEPRDLTQEQIESLRALSRQAVAQLELRRLRRERSDRQTGERTP